VIRSREGLNPKRDKKWIITENEKTCKGVPNKLGLKRGRGRRKGNAGDNVLGDREEPDIRV